MEEETVWLLFEGVCPTCGGDLEIVEVSGVKRFLAEHRFNGEFEQNVWKEGRWDDNDGMVAFRCPEGHRHEAYHSPSGDWMAA